MVPFDNLDFCSALSFLTEAESRFAHEMLRHHVRSAVSMMESWMPHVNIYLSGSLARREPSLRFEGGTVMGLQSDLDFIVVGDVSSAALYEYERALQTAFPGFVDTLHCYRPQQVPIIQSASARDFYLGLGQPLRVSVPLPQPSEFPVLPAYALEFLTYQIAATLNSLSLNRLNTQDSTGNPMMRIGGIACRSTEYTIHKLAVEALRAVTCVMTTEFERTITFAEVYARSDDYPLSKIISRKRINELLAQRERWSGSGIGLTDELAHIIACSLSCLTDKLFEDPEKVIIYLKENYYPSAHLVHVYPLAAIIAFLQYCDRLPIDGVYDIIASTHNSLRAYSPPELVDIALLDLVVDLRVPYIKSMIEYKNRGLPR